MSLQEKPSRVGRGATKFSPVNIQKIKDLLAQGFNREEIARALDVSVGSLQVTCSRLGISLRIPKIFDCSGGGRRTPVLSRPDHGKMRAGWQCARFQIVMTRNGVQRATDVPFMEPDIGRLGVEAAAQNRWQTVGDPRHAAWQFAPQSQEFLIGRMKFVVAEPLPRQFVTKWSGTPVWKPPAIAPSVTIDLPLEPVATAQSPKNANRWVPSLIEPFTGCAFTGAGLPMCRR